jgi:ABC-type lipoprotein release transport system permease subunit
MKKLVKLAFLNNYRRISRTVLALLGIIIGIASLILLVSVVDGLHKDMSDTISKMQGIMVYADAIPSPMFGTLSSSYVSKLNSIAGTKKVIPEVMHLIGEVNNKKQDFQGPGNSTVIIGVNAKDFDDSLYGGMIDTILKGSKLKESDAGFILISDKFAEDYKKTVGSSIDLDDKSFKIKGIFKSNSQTTESMIFANPDDIRKLYDIPNDEINYITVVPQNPSDTDKIKDIIEFRFNDLQAKTSQELIEQIGSILDNLKLLVIVIAIVAAIVAGIWSY